MIPSIRLRKRPRVRTGTHYGLQAEAWSAGLHNIAGIRSSVLTPFDLLTPFFTTILQGIKNIKPFLSLQGEVLQRLILGFRGY
jgi:hypothetical protein